MSTDRLPAIVLRDRDSIANGIVLVDANAVLALDRHIGLVIAAATEKIIPNAQIFAFELRGQSQACVVNLLVILWRCLRWNLSFRGRSEEHTSELQSLMRISYAVFCLKKKSKKIIHMYTYERIRSTAEKEYIDTIKIRDDK